MKKNNLFLYFSITSALMFNASTIQSKQRVYLPAHAINTITNENTVFLWDFHDVIAQRNLKKSFLTVWNSDKKLIILQNIHMQLLVQLLGMLGRSLLQNVTSEEMIQVVRQSNNPEFEKLIINVANVQDPITGTTHLIHELHKRGYRHYIGSNIGATIFADIINPKKYPQFATLFAHFDLTHPQTVTFDPKCPSCSIKKPDIRFYQEFLRRNAIDLTSTHVIFIDDRVENVIAAQKVGLIGIHFISPEQLRIDLEKLGVFTPSGSPVDFQSQPVV